jgi:demethylmenaquinone methyltransferase / 2-methoxy-6-polyprenyl-1,4-benzoquinol methylase
MTPSVARAERGPEQSPALAPAPPKERAAIRAMFDAVAERYDFLNHLLSAGLDILWRRRAAAAIPSLEGEPVLDLCCGTGDQALALTARKARVTAVDFCIPMLALAARKYAKRPAAGAAQGPPAGLAGDALALPFAGETFSAATVAFGLRNVADLGTALREIHRVLRPGGRVAFLEFALPRSRPLRAAYVLYFRRVLPLLGGWISGRSSAYTYLPDSVVEFPQREAFCAHMEEAGYRDAAWQDLSGGTVALYTGERAQ